jgi:glucoamylase
MPDQAVATGRYAEDVYFGGNVSEYNLSFILMSSSFSKPWYLCTAAVAEQLYDALKVWNKQGSLTVTVVSLSFFKQFAPVQPGMYDSSTPTFATLTSQIKLYADGFLYIMAKYTPKDGHLAEQFSRNDGNPLSAADLTWNYAAALTAFAARNGTTLPASWGAKGLLVPAVCQKYDGPAAQVTFQVIAYTVWGGEILFLSRM